MVEIRSRRARVHLRTVLIGAPFLASGVAFTSLGIAQELPGVVVTELFEQAIQEQISVPNVDDRGPASILTILVWFVGLGAVALVIRRRYSAALRPPAKRGLIPAAGNGPHE